MPRCAYPVPLLILLLTVGGCASTPSSGEVAPDRVRRDVLTRQQILETRSQNVFDALTALRSNCLIPPGVDSYRTPTQEIVYMNDTRLGGVETLRSIPVNDVGYIQYFDGIEASGRWGLDHGQGVIYLSALGPR
jgi:hypothetical protein